MPLFYYPRAYFTTRQPLHSQTKGFFDPRVALWPSFFVSMCVVRPAVIGKLRLERGRLVHRALECVRYAVGFTLPLPLPWLYRFVPTLSTRSDARAPRRARLRQLPCTREHEKAYERCASL